MKPNRARLTMLGRLHRLRSIEQKQALGQLAEAQDNWRRMTDLAERSNALSSQYGSPTGPVQAGELSTRHLFRAQMAELAVSAQQMDAEASGTRDLAGNKLAVAEHKLDSLSKRLESEQRQASAHRQAKFSNEQGGLARRLLKQEEKRSAPDTGEQP